MRTCSFTFVVCYLVLKSTWISSNLVSNVSQKSFSLYVFTLFVVLYFRDLAKTVKRMASAPQFDVLDHMMAALAMSEEDLANFTGPWVDGE